MYNDRVFSSFEKANIPNGKGFRAKEVKGTFSKNWDEFSKKWKYNINKILVTVGKKLITYTLLQSILNYCSILIYRYLIYRL